MVARHIEADLAEDLARSHGSISWHPLLTSTRGSGSAVIDAGPNLSVRIQLLSPVGRPSWPTEYVPVIQRYSDAPPARLKVPTVPAFVASKLIAWIDRRASRDLYDLWAMSDRGFIDRDALTLFNKYGQFNGKLPQSVFEDEPDDQEWQEDLSQQTAVNVSPTAAISSVRSAVERAAF